MNSLQVKSVYQFLTFDGNIYAATVDGIYKSTNEGQNWIKKSGGITIGPPRSIILSVEVYDPSGRRLETIFNGILPAKNKSVIWNAIGYS